MSAVGGYATYNSTLCMAKINNDKSSVIRVKTNANTNKFKVLLDKEINSFENSEPLLKESNLAGGFDRSV